MTGDARIPWPRRVFSRQQRAPTDDRAERFRQRVLPHLDAAYGYARYLARDASAAEDIVQDAFLRAFRHFDECRGNEKAWLLAIVRNGFHDWCRANRRFASDAALDESVADPPEDRPDAAAERSDDAARVRATLSALPEPFREALVLRELEELSYREIAVLTGAPVGTVMSRLARGRAMLARLLTDQDKGATGL